MSADSMNMCIEGLVSLRSPWLGSTSFQVEVPGCHVFLSSTWQETAGADFAAEVESVSRLYPAADEPPAASPEPERQCLPLPPVDDDESLVCGGTLLAHGDSPGQCVMSPSDALLVSPSDALLVSPSDALLVSPGDALLVSPSDALLVSPGDALLVSPSDALLVSPSDALLVSPQPRSSPTLSPTGSVTFAGGDQPLKTTPVLKTTPAAPDTAPRRRPPQRSGPTTPIARSPPVVEFASSPVAGFVTEPAPPPSVETVIEHVSPPSLAAEFVSKQAPPPAVETVIDHLSVAAEAHQSQLTDDEHACMIDQALEDLKTLENMCGIAFAEVATPPKHEKASSSESVASPPASIKTEPLDDDVQIVQEIRVGAPRRRRPPRVAVTPARRVSAAPQVVAAQPAAQIVIVLTEQQLASIQKSGKLVLSAAALRPAAPTGAAAAEPADAVRSAVGPQKRPRVSRISPLTKPPPKVAAGRAQKTTAKDPLSGWMQQKLPPAAADYCWEYPLLPAEPDPVPATDAGIPEDLQDLFLDSPGTVPALPDDNANTILEDLISDSVREHPELFGDLVTPEPRCADLIAICSPSQLSPQSADLMPSPSASDFSPSPPQMSLEAWAPTVSPSTCDPWSPTSVQADCELTSGPDWSPRLETPPGRRRQARPRPYDKTDRLNGGRKGQLTEEERRERKKEQNKNAATRYRQKKKEEHVVVSCDQDILETRNKQLRSRVLGLTKELTYLKQLMRDVLRHRPAAV